MSKTSTRAAGDQSTNVFGDASTETGSDTAIESDTEPDELSRDDAFEMLSNRRRRYAIQFLSGTPGPTSLSDLAEQVAAWENETSVAEISASERKTVYTSLQQFHLPKMADMGVIEFDQREGDVRLTESAADLDIYLELVDRYDIPWSLYYVGLSSIGIVLTSLAYAGIKPFAAVPFVGWTVFLIAVFTVSSACHYVLSRQMRIGSNAVPPEVDDA
ncbi:MULTISPECIES: DUF7344 domain-containing protein [Haloarcula]|uniref:DUF7344 domain-containing protein n=1 Tax=Haloarcula marismortui ATCC 33799 TaxID=662475 RepID=M0JRQ0_9EURY|nr:MULTISPECIES: hypothetical protein [Haloarcula]EMA11822.1 hypothetical protein C435_18154 [Haloarcula californiae ATCC 33799]